MKISRFITAASIIWSSLWLAPVIAGIVGISTIYGMVSIRELLFFVSGAVFFSAFTRRRCED